MKESIENFGPIHILIANHGIFPPDDVLVKDMSLNQWNNTISCNLTGVFLYAREFLKQLEESKENEDLDEYAKSSLETSNIVMVGSTSGMFGEVGHADYSCTKSAMIYGLCLTLKNEIVKIVKKGRSNVVSPGWVLTPMAQKAIDKDETVIDKAVQTVAMKKIASAEEVANSIVYLSSDLASHTSGLNFEVTGGMEGRCLNPLSNNNNN
eukprot:TRINITY_DN281_c0_g1_i3.p1 TRINITY_DN281_c0_g1~~TRINITY_DN281_c0_g1_i3.p1  ORF type:complete len:209 (-),score=72.24 TRINITY_DN281_c0_g1_i3:78-704(-)